MADGLDTGPERVGLLFVHGIGQQERFEHLRSAAAEFAEYMVQSEPGASAAVVDRTADWKLPPGSPDPDHLAPITLTIRSPARDVVFDCHEAWWADLGERTGLASELRFWIWGLGQWGAPIYRELDGAGVSKAPQADGRVRSTLTKLPGISIAGNWREPWARLQLAIASLCTMFVCVTLVLAKRVFAKLLATAPTPTLLVEYVGDVRTYEARAAPGDTVLPDPGYPRRVGIRRRMVTEMVAMGSNPALDRWYVLAHSQGTVLAYNGLTEIGHALPNYLSEAQWIGLPEALKRDSGCMLRPEAQRGAMMPARPDWLVHEDVINRPALFAKLGGLLTYGSPLNKFAALWPRIVATATDRADATPVFGTDCRWINLRAYQDPVAGDLASYSAKQSPTLIGAIPPLENIDTPYRPNFMISHIQYFRGVERFVPANNAAAAQRRGIGRWLLHGDTAGARIDLTSHSLAPPVALLLVFLPYLAILGLLAVLGACFVAAAGGVAAALLDGRSAGFTSVHDFAHDSLRALLPVINAAMLVLLFAGYWRWLGESMLNLKLTRAARAADIADGEPLNTRYWGRVMALNRLQQWTALLVIALTLAALSAIKLRAIGDAPWLSWQAARRALGLFESRRLLAALAISLAAGIVAQTLANALFRPGSEKRDAPTPARLP